MQYRINRKKLLRIHFFLGMLALALACCEGMYTQENTMADAGMKGPLMLMAALFMTPVLLPNSERRMKMPNIGMIAFCLLMIYCVGMLFAVDNGQKSIDIILTILMYFLSVVALIATYRWYSFNSLGKTDGRIFLIMFFLFLFTYIKIVTYLLSNLIVEHLATSYYTLYMLPILLLHKSWKIKLLCVVLTFIAVLTSMKRGGAAALLVGVMIYAFVYLRSKNMNVVKLTVIFSLAAALIGGLAFFLGSMGNEEEEKNLIERFESVQEDGGSNRDMVYAETLKLISSQEIGTLIVGNGFNAVLKDSPIHYSAHNDFMEILYDYGLIGFTLYVIFTFSFLKLALTAFNRKAPVAPTLCFQFSNFFLLSNTSHIFIYMFLPLMLITYGIGAGQMRYYNNHQE